MSHEESDALLIKIPNHPIVEVPIIDDRILSGESPRNLDKGQVKDGLSDALLIKIPNHPIVEVPIIDDRILSGEMDED
ncbi:MAG: hypothetical protein ACTSUE_01920 [Promethearchaeota archaeon]